MALTIEQIMGISYPWIVKHYLDEKALIPTSRDRLYALIQELRERDANDDAVDTVEFD